MSPFSSVENFVRSLRVQTGQFLWTAFIKDSFRRVYLLQKTVLEAVWKIACLCSQLRQQGEYAARALVAMPTQFENC